MPGIETNDFAPEIAEFVPEPWRHRSGLDPYASVISRMPLASLTAALSFIFTPPSIRPRNRSRRFRTALVKSRRIGGPVHLIAISLTKSLDIALLACIRL